MVKDLKERKDSSWILDNVVTIIFVVFTVVGFAVSTGVSVN